MFEDGKAISAIELQLLGDRRRLQERRDAFDAVDDGSDHRHLGLAPQVGEVVWIQQRPGSPSAYLRSRSTSWTDMHFLLECTKPFYRV